MAHFVKPNGISSEGYDVDNKLAPGSLWRVRVPLGKTRLVGLCLGDGLKVTSNNTNVVPNDRQRPEAVTLKQVSVDSSVRTFELYGGGVGGSWIDVWGPDGSFWIHVQALVDQPEKLFSEVTDKTKLATNLALSMDAVSYVLKTVGIKAANYDKYRGEPCAEKGTAKMNALDRCVYEKTRSDARAEIASKSNPLTALDWMSVTEAELARRSNPTMLEKIRIHADHAKADKCGNCGENADLAFIYLYDRGVRPIDRVEHTGDHNFVVIGRQDGAINDTASWGPAAVICDPWMQGLFFGDTQKGSYPASQLEAVQRIKKRKLELLLVYREA
jgi:hypothetical protein